MEEGWLAGIGKGLFFTVLGFLGVHDLINIIPDIFVDEESES